MACRNMMCGVVVLGLIVSAACRMEYMASYGVNVSAQIGWQNLGFVNIADDADRYYAASKGTGTWPPNDVLQLLMQSIDHQFAPCSRCRTRMSSSGDKACKKAGKTCSPDLRRALCCHGCKIRLLLAFGWGTRSVATIRRAGTTSSTRFQRTCALFWAVMHCFTLMNAGTVLQAMRGPVLLLIASRQIWTSSPLTFSEWVRTAPAGADSSTCHLHVSNQTPAMATK